jgi:hypothetical protein
VCEPTPHGDPWRWRRSTTRSTSIGGVRREVSDGRGGWVAVAPRCDVPTAERCDAPVGTTTCARPEERWPQPQATPVRVVPHAWRTALTPQALHDAHGRLRGAQDAACRRAVIVELASTVTLTVDQVVVLVAALPTSCERLDALTALHAATTDKACYRRLYALLEAEDQETLHVRITPTYDARTASQRARLERLRQEERELERVLGDE